MKSFYAAGFLLLATLVLADKPIYDEEACFPREKIMDAGSQAKDCEWIKNDPTVEFEKDKDRIYNCYSKRFQFITKNGSFDVKKCLEAYDAIGNSQKIGDIRKAFTDCASGREDVIPVEETDAFRKCFTGRLAKICPKST